jgi:hypothetical protein
LKVELVENEAFRLQQSVIPRKTHYVPAINAMSLLSLKHCYRNPRENFGIQSELAMLLQLPFLPMLSGAGTRHFERTEQKKLDLTDT